MMDQSVINEYFAKMAKVQHIVLKYVENENQDTEKIQKITTKIKNIINSQNKSELTTFLHLINTISQFHCRTIYFFTKFEMILKSFREEIIKYFTNNEIFNIFIDNKRVLLFLFKEKILIPNKTLANKIVQCKKYDLYCEYFYPEFKKFYDESLINEVEMNIGETYLNNPELFEKNREIGENEKYICQLIRNDSVKEFIIYVNKNNINLSSKIDYSIFETNFIITDQKEMSLIEYAAFFGSIQIFKYLDMNYVEIDKESIFISILSSKNPDLIHFYEEEFGYENDDILYNIFLYSLIFHHNDISLYFLNNFLNIDRLHDFEFLSSYNFLMFQIILPINGNYISDVFCLDDFIKCCEYDYGFVVDFLLKNNWMNIYSIKYWQI